MTELKVLHNLIQKPDRLYRESLHLKAANRRHITPRLTTMQRSALVLCALLVAGASAEVFFKETFDCRYPLYMFL